MQRPVDNDQGSELLRVYAVFGIDPLDRVDEFGFRFPRLSVDFLREKAKHQLRDALGRWREMRGTLDLSEGRVERAGLRRSRPDRPEIEPFNPDPVETVRKYEEKLGNYKLKQDFTTPSETFPIPMREYVLRYEYEQARAEIARRSGTTLDPKTTRWMKDAELYESGRMEDEVPAFDLPQNPSPLVEGTPRQRFENMPETVAYIDAMQTRKSRLEKEAATQNKWYKEHLAVSRETHRILIEKGHNDPPLLLPKNEFETYQGKDVPGWIDPDAPKGSGTILYRGKNGLPNHPDLSPGVIMAKLQSALPEDHYVGLGIYGNGLYFGTANTGAYYAGLSIGDVAGSMESRIAELVGSVAVAKLKPEATVLFRREFEKMLKTMDPAIIERIEQDNPAFSDQEKESLFAALNNIDAVNNGVGNLVVFNRSALVMADLGLPTPPRPQRPEPLEIPSIPELPPGILPKRKQPRR